MADIFLKAVNMSISACWIILAVMVLRLLLKKAPKWINCILWGFAGLRLVVPFSFESIFSLVPSAEFVPQKMIHSNSTVDVSGAEILKYIGNNPVSYEFGFQDGSLVFHEITATDGNYVNPLLLMMYIASIVWVMGIAVLLLYTIVSFVRLKGKIATAVLLRDSIYQSEAVGSPFVLGIIKPKIFLPFHMNEQDMKHVIAHEQAHLCRKDHIWKPLGFLILTLHWFNPLVWLGYVLFCRDIELACDEKVVKAWNAEQRADYSEALLACSVNRRTIAACPLAFGEVSVKDRVKSVLHYKKPAFWMIAAAIAASIVVAVCFLTNPIKKSIWNSQYETSKCLYSDVIDEKKETKINELVFNITSDGIVYKSFNKNTTKELGKLRETDFTNSDFTTLGAVKNAYEVPSDVGNYVFLQKANGLVYLVSLYSNGDIMNVFKLKRIGDCEVSAPPVGNDNNYKEYYDSGYSLQVIAETYKGTTPNPEKTDMYSFAVFNGTKGELSNGTKFEITECNLQHGSLTIQLSGTALYSTTPAESAAIKEIVVEQGADGITLFDREKERSFTFVFAKNESLDESISQ